MDEPFKLNIASKAKASGFFREWIKCIVGLIAFVPFLLMLLVHRMLGLSDALLAGPHPGEPFWPIYNLLMVLAIFAGFVGYVVYLVQSIPED